MDHIMNQDCSRECHEILYNIMVIDGTLGKKADTLA